LKIENLSKSKSGEQRKREEKKIKEKKNNDSTPTNQSKIQSTNKLNNL
jgi:hypothetical protein